MSAIYELRLYSPDGTFLDIPTFISLTYSRKVNQVGSLIVTLSDYYWSIIKPDSRLEVWRSIDNNQAYLEMETSWICLIFNRDYDNSLMTVEAFDGLHLLKRRNILWPANSSQSLKTTYLDDMCKAVVRENLSSSATAITAGIARNISNVLAVQADLGLAPSSTKGFAYKGVLETLQELAKESYTKGTYLAFDVVCFYPGYPQLHFRTYTNQRGDDHTQTGFNPVVLSPEFSNLVGVKYTIDYSNEYNYVLAGGQGENAARQTAVAYDLARIGQSPIGLKEAFKDSRQATTTAALQADADSFLRDGRPIKTIVAEIVNQPGTQYGIDWRYGDKLTGSIGGESFTCMADYVSVSYDASGEKIKAQIRSVS